MQAANELLSLQVTDPQAGFKPFTLTALAAAMPQVTDHRLSFDTDLLGALQNTGNHVIEVDIAALHRYMDGQVGTPRDYDTILAEVHQQAVHHGLDPSNRDIPTWDRIREAGPLTTAAAPNPYPSRSHPHPLIQKTHPVKPAHSTALEARPVENHRRRLRDHRNRARYA